MRLLLFLIFVATSACGESVAVSLVFPSQNILDQADRVALEIYDGSLSGERAPDAICRALSSEASAPGDLRPLTFSSQQSICDFSEGTFALEGVPIQRVVLFAKIENLEGGDLLRGCTIADVQDAPSVCSLNSDCPNAYRCIAGECAIAISLATLPNYQDIPVDESQNCN